MLKNVTAIIPAYNEADNILRTVRSIKNIDLVNEIIVVDDGSKDSTYDAIKDEKNIIIIRHELNKGKGKAIKSGLLQATNSYVAFVDADLCESAYEIRQLIEKVLEYDNAMIIGQLPAPKKKGGFGIVKYTSRKSFKYLTSLELKSLLSGQRVMPKDFLLSIDIPDDFSLEFKLSLEAVRKQLKIVEVPVDIHHRETERNLKGFIHRGKQFQHIVKAFLKEVR